MISYWFEHIGKMWIVYAYKDTARLYPVQSCFTRKEAVKVSEKLNKQG
jgi:hypothetical protein